MTPPNQDTEVDEVGKILKEMVSALYTKPMADGYGDAKEQINQLIQERESRARVDELTWFRGYHHKAIDESVWKYLNDRIEELSKEKSE